MTTTLSQPAAMPDIPSPGSIVQVRGREWVLILWTWQIAENSAKHFQVRRNFRPKYCDASLHHPRYCRNLATWFSPI